MTFFKVIQEKTVVSVGCVFLKWNIKKNALFVCDVDKGEFVQSYDEKHIYHDDWLKSAPKEAGKHEEAEIVIITQQEYEDLLAILDEGEVVIETPPIEEPQEEMPEAPVEEKPMSISEMRETIAHQQEQIDMLIKKLK